MDASNFFSWSIHVRNTFRTMGPIVERVVVSNISTLIDWHWNNYRFTKRGGKMLATQFLFYRCAIENNVCIVVR